MDGPAIFDNVKGCHISVAAQQLQVRSSTDSEFAVYSANKPTIEHSTGLEPLLLCNFIHQADGHTVRLLYCCHSCTCLPPCSCKRSELDMQSFCSAHKLGVESERQRVSLEWGDLSYNKPVFAMHQYATTSSWSVCMQSCASRAGWGPTPA